MSIIGIHVDKGSHASLSAALKAADQAIGRPLAVAQIFTHGPRSAARISGYSDDDLKAECQKRRIYIHQTYMTSWSKNVEHMREQYRVAKTVGSRGLVLHLGDLNPQTHIEVLKTLDLVDGCPVLLEMRALKPPTPEELKSQSKWSYQHPEQINAMTKAIREAGFPPSQIGIVFDTAHLAAGQQPIGTVLEMADWLELIVDWDYVKLVHLNGNQYDCRIRAGDKHCIPASKLDTVFSEDRRGYRELVAFCREQSIDVIVECDLDTELPNFVKSLEEKKDN